jgi:hypothetical protein
MTTKPKPRGASAVAKAIARHKTAQAAYDAAPDDSDATLIPLSDATFKALNKLAKTPCTSDAEFIEKLRYLAAQEAEMYSSPTGMHEYGSVVIAVALHLEAA